MRRRGHDGSSVEAVVRAARSADDDVIVVGIVSVDWDRITEWPDDMLADVTALALVSDAPEPVRELLASELARRIIRGAS